MRRWLVALLVLAVPVSAAGAPSSKQVAIIIDTSGSMNTSDRPRYTVQIAQIISDLLEPGDQLTVVRLPQSETCSAGPDPALAVKLDPSNPAAFKEGLDRLITYGGNNHFAGPVRTAIHALSLDPNRPRLLLMLADSGGLDVCEAPLTRELVQLRQSGAIVAAINIGPSGGAFDTNPAFSFTTGALDAEQLTRSVAEVYQRFLGSRQVQTGRVGERIEVQIHPYVREAFLVVAADGPIGGIEVDPKSPAARAIDRNHRGGGQTRGLDGRTRGYRIVRLQRPAEGTWTFTVPGLSGQRAGWLLLQEHVLAARLISTSAVSGTPSLLELELYDEETGQRVTDTSKLTGLEVAVEIDGGKVTFRDDGTGGDRRAHDGIVSATHTFRGTGSRSLVGHLRTDVVDRAFKLDVRVLETGWQLRPLTPSRADAGTPVVLKVQVVPIGIDSSLARPPERIEARLSSGRSVTLKDTGDGGDERAGDRVYSATWTAADVGDFDVTYVPVGGSPAEPVKAGLTVVGRIEFGPPVPVNFGSLRGRTVAERLLDLSTARVHGAVELEMTSGLRRSGTALEIQTPQGWQRLDGRRVAMTVPDRGAPSWPVRLRVGDCPAGSSASDLYEIVLQATTAEGKVTRLVVPVTAEVLPDAWLQCWWPFLVAAALAVLAAIVVHGYWSPSRFARGLGVQISDDPDLGEGFLHPIHAQRGTRSGFYRDARVYVCSDYRLRGRAVNALARLHARGSQVLIQPAGGSLVLRQTADGDWEELPDHEVPVRAGVAYRNDAKTVFFELRTR